jgi:small subunit ribosomal protein S18
MEKENKKNNSTTTDEIEKNEKATTFRRRRARPNKDATFDYKDIETLKQFITEEGKIIPARITKLNRKQQRDLTLAVKRARHLALLPTSSKYI